MLLAQDTNLGTIKPPSERFSADTAAANNPQGVLSNLENLISTGIGMLTVLAGLFFIVFFFLAALKWLTAGGDAGKVQKARDEMVQGVMGLVLIVAAYGIIGLIGQILGLQLLDPAGVINSVIEGAQGS